MVFCSFMNLVAIVGFAVVKVIDTCITAKHMYDEGYIGHKYRNNYDSNNSYAYNNRWNSNYPRNNRNYSGNSNSQYYYNNEEPRWNDGLSVTSSRRNDYTAQSVQYNNNTNVPQNYMGNVSYGYAYSDDTVVNQIEPNSRRWNNTPNPVYGNPNYQGTYIPNNAVSYPQNMYNNNYQYPYSYQSQQHPYQQPQYNGSQQQYPQSYQTQEFKWSNETVGERRNKISMVNNASMYPYGYGDDVQPSANACYVNNNNNKGGDVEFKWHDESFMKGRSINKKSPYDQSWKPYDQNGVVPALYTDDGQPLFGPMPYGY